jgi:hypothetical protein
MTPRSWVGVGLAVMVFGLFGLYLWRDGELSAVAGFIFGGGLLFCGLLIDPAEFRSVFAVWRGKPPEYPPPPGGQEGKFPTGEDK